MGEKNYYSPGGKGYQKYLTPGGQGNPLAMAGIQAMLAKTGGQGEGYDTAIAKLNKNHEQGFMRHVPGALKAALGTAAGVVGLNKLGVFGKGIPAAPQLPGGSGIPLPGGGTAPTGQPSTGGGTDIMKTLGGLFTKPDGSIDLEKLLKIGVGAAGVIEGHQSDKAAADYMNAQLEMRKRQLALAEQAYGAKAPLREQVLQRMGTLAGSMGKNDIFSGYLARTA